MYPRKPIRRNLNFGGNPGYINPYNPGINYPGQNPYYPYNQGYGQGMQPGLPQQNAYPQGQFIQPVISPNPYYYQGQVNIPEFNPQAISYTQNPSYLEEASSSYKKRKNKNRSKNEPIEEEYEEEYDYEEEYEEPVKKKTGKTKVPVKTGDSDDRLKFFKSRFTGESFEPKEPSSSEVQVTVKRPKLNQKIEEELLQSIQYSSKKNKVKSDIQNNYQGNYQSINHDSKLGLEIPDNQQIKNYTEQRKEVEEVSHNDFFDKQTPQTGNFIPQDQFSSKIYTDDFQTELKQNLQNKLAENNRRQAFSDSSREEYNSFDYSKSSSPRDFSQRLDSNYYTPQTPTRFYRVPKKKKNKTRQMALAVFFMISLVLSMLSWNFYNTQIIGNNRSIAGAQDEPIVNDYQEYKAWIESKLGIYSEPTEDVDNDGLTNYEEFLIKSNPNSANTCDKTKTDMDNLLDLINPATCEPIDFDDPDELEIFSKIIDVQAAKKATSSDDKNNKNEPLPSSNSSIEESETNSETNESSSDSSEEISYNTQSKLLSALKLNEYSQISSLSFEEVSSRSTSEEEKDLKLKYINLVKKIENYIKQYRSYEPYDVNYETPVHPAVFLDVSLEYNVELKYVLAVARKESRFGTDRYTNNGNLTRPGKYKNIYSIGLDDSGNNLGYKTWEEGVKGFGKWYQKFEQRGVDDCSKWRIYNPNGDYCATIEGLASEIQKFLEG